MNPPARPKPLLCGIAPARKGNCNHIVLRRFIMTYKEWVVVESVPGDLQAEILRGLLEAQGIPVLLSRESAGRAIGLGVGPLGEVIILVHAENQQDALSVLANYRAGLFEIEEDQDQGEEQDSD
jgi:hypothetical protein